VLGPAKRGDAEWTDKPIFSQSNRLVARLGITAWAMESMWRGG
jgi:hypothetical protein